MHYTVEYLLKRIEYLESILKEHGIESIDIDTNEDQLELDCE